MHGSYTFEVMEFKAFQGFSRLLHGIIQGYFSDEVVTWLTKRALLGDIIIPRTHHSSRNVYIFKKIINNDRDVFHTLHRTCADLLG